MNEKYKEGDLLMLKDIVAYDGYAQPAVEPAHAEIVTGIEDLQVFSMPRSMLDRLVPLPPDPEEDTNDDIITAVATDVKLIHTLSVGNDNKRYTRLSGAIDELLTDKVTNNEND